MALSEALQHYERLSTPQWSAFGRTHYPWLIGMLSYSLAQLSWNLESAQLARLSITALVFALVMMFYKIISRKGEDAFSLLPDDGSSSSIFPALFSNILVFERSARSQAYWQARLHFEHLFAHTHEQLGTQANPLLCPYWKAYRRTLLRRRLYKFLIIGVYALLATCLLMLPQLHTTH